jgi:hypothetical protein
LFQAKQQWSTILNEAAPADSIRDGFNVGIKGRNLARHPITHERVQLFADSRQS